MENVHFFCSKESSSGTYTFSSRSIRNIILIVITPLICVVTMAFKVLYKSILHCSVHRVTASRLNIVLPYGSMITIYSCRYTSINTCNSDSSENGRGWLGSFKEIIYYYKLECGVNLQLQTLFFCRWITPCTWKVDFYKSKNKLINSNIKWLVHLHVFCIDLQLL